MAAVGAVGVVAVVVGHRASPWLAAWLAVVVAVSTWLAIVDFRIRRLPNRIVLPLAGGVIVAVVVAGVATDDLDRSWRALAMGAAVTAVLLVANLIGGLGMGDVKYGFPMAATVGWFGWDSLSVAILVTTVSGAAVAIAMLLAGRGRRWQLSYGPYMALGLVVGLVTAGSW